MNRTITSNVKLLHELILAKDKKGYIELLDLDNKKLYEKEYLLLEFECMCNREDGAYINNPAKEFEYKFKELINISLKYGADMPTLSKILNKNSNV